VYTSIFFAADDNIWSQKGLHIFETSDCKKISTSNTADFDNNTISLINIHSNDFLRFHSGELVWDVVLVN